jgi:hypothetical protein
MVLHDLHDIRISSTDVTTVTRLLGCDAGVNSIAPLTLAKAASLLGGLQHVNAPTLGANKVDWDNIRSGSMPSCYIANYNDATGTLGYPVSGSAGIYIVAQTYVIVLAYYSGYNKGVYITKQYNKSISEMEKVV